jgi:dGTPase
VRKTDQRDPWSRDRSRIIHSAAFRRLQAKTQILGLHQGDFYRTRLTHSLEVAQIGSGIVEFLQTQAQNDSRKDCQDCYQHLPSPYLIEAICMAHDLGHPPFGHGGEVALNIMMRQHGGFEGNGQTLRILSKLGEHSDHHGQDLTRRALLGVMKYPVLYPDVVRQDADYQQMCQRPLENVRLINTHIWQPPKSLLAEEGHVRDWVISPFSPADQDTLTQHKRQEGAHAKACYHALDTAIMDLADDIAYGVHDLEDAIAMGMIREQDWRQQVLTDPTFTDDTGIDHEQITQWLFSDQSRQTGSPMGT